MRGMNRIPLTTHHISHNAIMLSIGTCIIIKISSFLIPQLLRICFLSSFQNFFIFLCPFTESYGFEERNIWSQLIESTQKLREKREKSLKKEKKTQKYLIYLICSPKIRLIFAAAHKADNHNPPLYALGPNALHVSYV